MKQISKSWLRACTVVLRQKGSDGINDASQLRGDNVVTLFIQTVERRRAYTNSKAISEFTKAQPNCSPTRNIRSQTSSFQFRDHYLLCSQPAKYSSNKRGNDVFPVRTSDFQATFMQVCTERNDTWAHTIRGRIEFAQDLHAADAIYHPPSV